MRKHFAAALFLCLLAPPALSQTATSTGVGVGVSNSSSRANSVAIGGGNATGGRATGGNSSSALTVNNNGQPSGTVTSTNVTTSGSTSVKTVPSVFAPGLGAAGLETCLGSVSGGGSAMGWGATFGTTIPDPGCAARLDARTLWAMGLKGAAVARLCQMGPIYNSMPDVCQKYMPRVAYAQAAAAVTPGAYVGTGGRIELIDGKTGQNRWCDSYDAAKQHCRRWAVIP